MPNKNSSKSLPEEFQGFKTRDLLDLWVAIGPPPGPNAGPEKMSAMQDLLRDYKIAPVSWRNLPEDKQEALRMLKAFGHPGRLQHMMDRE
jgi:hypothetical protein